MTVDKHFTTAQAAEILEVTDDGIVALIHSGELVATNVARSADSKRPRWRISESDLGRFLLSRRHSASVTPRPAKRTRSVSTTEFFS